MLQFPKHGNKENLERNSRLRIASGPVFTRHLNATTTMAVRSVTSSPGASLERRFKGRGTWDVGRGARDEEKRAARNNHCSLTLFLTLTLRKEGRGTRPRERFELQGTTTAHSPCFLHSHYVRSCEERGTWNKQLFTVYCSLFTPAYAKASAGRIHYSLFAIHCSLQRNIPMLLPRQLHRFGFEHPEGADQF